MCLLIYIGLFSTYASFYSYRFSLYNNMYIFLCLAYVSCNVYRSLLISLLMSLCIIICIYFYVLRMCRVMYISLF